MFLSRLKVFDAPGVHEELELAPLEPGVNLVWGPNASGKSTVARALRSLFEAAPGDGVRVSALVDHAGRVLEVVRPHGGAPVWPPGGPNLDRGFDPELYALDLSVLLYSDDASLARHFTEELFGGVDLEAARAARKIPSPTRATEPRKRDAARQQLARARQDALALARDEARLAELGAERDRAREAMDQARAVDTLLELIDDRATLARLEQARAALEPGVERVPADALDRLAELREAEARQADTLAELRERHRRLREKRASEAFAIEAPRAEVLAARRADAERLRGLGTQLAAALGEQDEAEAEEAAASQAFFHAGRPEGEPEPISEAESARLHRALADFAAARVEQRGAEQLAREAESWHGEASQRAVERNLPADLDELRRGRDALQAWLSLTPDAHRVALGIFGALAGVAGVGLGAGLYALVFGLRIPTFLTVLGGLSAIAAGAVYLFRLLKPPAPDARRALLEETARSAGVVPAEWTREGVVRRLTEAWELLADRASHDRILVEARGAANRAEDAATRLHEDADTLGARLGFTVELADLDTHERARRLIDLIEAQAKVARATSRVLRLEQEVGALRDPLRAFFEGLGVEAGFEPEGLAAVASEVSLRAGELASLDDRLATTALDLEREEEESVRLEARLAQAWEGWGLDAGSESALRRLAEQVPLLEELETKQRETRARLERGREQLHARSAPHLPLDPETASRDEALALKAELEASAEKADALTDEIAAIEQAVKAAGTRTTLEEANAELIAAERALEEARDLGLSRSLVDLCLCDARDSFVAEHRPDRLRRAMQLFSAFTRGQWKLVLDPSSASFTALDTGNDLPRSLTELSDGTRVHLLLAARLAAIESQEKGGVALPLCLDELLSTTDPTRFDEVCAALFELADAGRQIFYFTADPAEVSGWQRAAARLPKEGDARRLGIVSLEGARVPADWGDAHDLGALPLEAPAPPPPADGNANAYARTLGVPRPEGHRPANQWHLLHLLFDHLEALPLLLEQSLRTLGHWRAVWGEVPPEARAPFLARDLRSLIELRGALLEETLAAWREGRGRPLRWEHLEESGAMSSAFTERFRELLDETGPDGAAFVAAIDEKRVNGFRKGKRDLLVTFLTEQGVLTTERPLERDTIVRQVLGRTQPLLSTRPGGEREARAYIEHLLSLLSPRADRKPPPQLELIGGRDG